MSPFITYIVKAGIIYSMFFILYRLLFSKETFFKRNRVFLFISLILPALIPLISFPVNSSFGGLVSERGTSWIMIAGNTISEHAQTGGSSMVSEPAVHAGSPGLSSFILMIYLLGLSFFIIRIIYNYSRIIRLIISSEKQQIYKMILIITRKMVSPFSIFKWLVIPDTKKDDPDLDKIVGHEMVHYKQKHSYDLLLSELVIAFQWFNPFVWMLKSSVIKNNEFLVDQTLINDVFDQKEYQYALLNNSVGQQKLAMVNSFSKGLIKNRIKMMNRKKTRLVNRAKEIVIIPFALILILAFSAYTNKATDFAQDQDRKIVKKEQKTEQRKIVRKDTWTVAKNEDRKIVGSDTWTIPQDQDKKKKKKGEKEHISIFVDGKMIKIKNPDSSGEDDGHVKIIKLSELEDMELDGEIDKKKLVEKLAQFKSDNDNTVLLIKESEKDGENVDIYVGAMVTTKSDTGESGVIYIKNDDGEISVFSSEGEEKTIYVTEKDGKEARIHIKTDNPGKDMLFVIDGKIVDAEAFENLDSEKIYSISILDSEDAKKEFGDKAKDGVIKVTTKK